jgi:hypothetical protein
MRASSSSVLLLSSSLVLGVDAFSAGVPSVGAFIPGHAAAGVKMLPFEPLIGTALHLHDTIDEKDVHTVEHLKQELSHTASVNIKGPCGKCSICACARKKGTARGSDVSMSAACPARENSEWEKRMVLSNQPYLESVMRYEENALKELDAFLNDLSPSAREATVADLLDSLG